MLFKRAKPRRERARSASVASPQVEDLQKAAAVTAFDRGKDALAAGRIELAEAEFWESDRLGNPAGSVNLGNLLRMRGDLRGAEAAFRRAVRRGNSNGSLNLGAMYLDRGRLRTPRGSSCGLGGQAIGAHRSSCRSWRNHLTVLRAGDRVGDQTIAPLSARRTIGSAREGPSGSRPAEHLRWPRLTAVRLRRPASAYLCSSTLSSPPV